MKRTIKSIVTLVAVAVAGVSCLQLEQPALNEILSGDEIVFGASPLFMAETKATEVTSLSSFYVSAVTGNAGSESSVFTSSEFTQIPASNPAVYKGSKMWPSTDQNWKFYASNVPLTFDAAGTTVAATNTTDVVCAYLTNGTYKTKNTLSFEHIFARIDKVTVVAVPGNTISNVNIRIIPKNGGTYNLRTGAGQIDDSGWSSLTTGSSTQIANALGENDNDLWLVPGTYTLYASWTAVPLGGVAVNYTDIETEVVVQKGKENNISASLGAGIQVGVDLREYEPVNYAQDNPLIFEAIESGSILWKTNNASWVKVIEYSKDNGQTWTELTPTTSGAAISVTAGDKVMIRGNNLTYCNDGGLICFFSGTSNYYVYGDLTNLLRPGFRNYLQPYAFCSLFLENSKLRSHPTNKLYLPSSVLSPYCYQNMFKGCESLTSAPDLPATTLAQSCYQNMFSGCESLTSAPDLPATTLAQSCYQNMFNGCSSLISAPELPATTLASSCYSYMFNGCSSLTSAPELPATTLASGCYSSMFNVCSSLTSAPELPATTLESYCYYSMFYGCSSLTSAPELPATTLAYYCYYSMFNGCSSLTSAPELPATTLADSCYSYMFNGCSSLTSAPEQLPATTLASSCYYYMFYGCSSLTTAPELPATRLVSGCYSGMFRDCSSLNYIKALFTTSPSSSYTSSWVYGVASTGAFVKNLDATWTMTGAHSVPTGWTVYTEATDPRRTIGRFTINASGDQVGFASGNLQAVIGSGPDATGFNYTASKWKFAEHQWDYIGDNAGNNSFAIGSTVDLFGWVGASASYDSYGLCTQGGMNNEYYGTSGSDALNTDWGSIPGVVSALGSGWRTLTDEEYGYLFNSRPNASSRYGFGSINGIVGMIILPDVWTLPANCSFSVSGAYLENVYTLGASGTTNAWVDMEAAGAVFLPAAGDRFGASVENVGSYGEYWSSSVYSVYQTQRMHFHDRNVEPQREFFRCFGCSVRLVKEAK